MTGALAALLAASFGTIAHAALLAPTAAMSFSPPSVYIGTEDPTELTIVLTNPNPQQISGVAFTDNYPAGMLNAMAGVTSNTCGGSLQLVANGSTLVLGGGSIQGNSSCAVAVSVWGFEQGVWTNTSGPIASANTPNGTAASADLTVNLFAAPTATMAFVPSSITAGGTSQMQVTFSNPNVSDIEGLQFNDAYPAGMVNVASYVVVENTCGGTITAAPNFSSAFLGGGTIPAKGSCIVAINVTSASNGSYNNSTGTILSSNAADGAAAGSVLNVSAGNLLAAPAALEAFNPSTVTLGGGAHLTLTLINQNQQPITGVQFRNVYPAGIVNATAGAVLSNTCGGTVAAPDDGSFVALTGGTIATNSSCVITIKVVGTAPGQISDSTGPIASANTADGASATASLTVVSGANLAAPGFAKSFSPSTIAVGQTTQMTITLTNPNALAIVGLHMNDIYPTGIENAPSGALLSNSCGGVVSPLDYGFSGTEALFLSDGVVPANGSCSVVVNVVGTAIADSIVNTVQAVSDNSNAPGDASATLKVTPVAPQVSKSFSPQNIVVGGVSELSIKLTNSNVQAITGVSFADNYPAGIANLSNGQQGVLSSNTCGGSLSATPNGTSVSLSGGTIQASATCEVDIAVVGTASGSVQNNTGLVTSADAPDGASAQGNLTVSGGSLLAPPRIVKSFLPASVTAGGTSQMTIMLTNTNGSDVTGAQFADSYPVGIANSPDAVNGNSVIVSNTCGGTATAIANTASAALTQGVIPANGSCSVVVNVVGSVTATNQSGQVFSANATPGSSAAATLTVTPPPLLSAPNVTKSFVPSTVTLGDSSLMTIALSNPNATNIVGAQFTDIYPNGMVNADAGNGTAIVSNTCGGTVTATTNGLSAALANGTIPASGCQVVVKVIATAAGSLLNQTGAIPSGNAHSGNSNNATLNVNTGAQLAAPTVSKAFFPTFVSHGGTSQMTIKLTNPNALAIVGAAFDDAYPNGIANDDSGVPLSNTCGGSLTMVSGGSSVSLAGGTIPANGSCSIVLNVVGTANSLGWVNHTGSVTSDNAADGADASASLGVNHNPLLNAPTVTKTFVPSSIAIGVSSLMTITLANSDPGKAITAAEFLDQYPAGMVNAQSGAVVNNTCGGTLTADSNDSKTSLAGATIPASSSCSVTIEVIGTAQGQIFNQTGKVSSSNANDGDSGSATLIVNSAGATPQTISFTSTAPNNAAVAGPTYQVTAVATSGLPVALTIDGSSSAVCTISSGTVSFIGVGTCTIDANQSGDATYAPAPQVQQSFIVSNAGGGNVPQTITFTSTAPGNATVGGPSYLATATATSGLPVVLTIDGVAATVCTINNGTVTFIGAGTCIVDANQSGDATYAPAPQVQQTFTVSNAGGGNMPQTITFTSTAPVNASVAGPTYLATATATSGLSVVLTIDGTSATVCTINNGTVSFIGAGTCTIDANQGGNATYAPAPQVQQSFMVSNAGGGNVPQTITFTSTAPINAVVAGPTYQATATATSGLPVILTIDAVSTTVCTINNNTVSFIGAGICTIDANQGGNATYAPAPQVQQTFTVSDGGSSNLPQTIMFTSSAPGNATVAGPTYLPAATATSGLPVVLTINGASATVCSISNGTVSFIGAGTCTIDADQGGNAIYAPAPQVQQSFTVSSAGGVNPQTITFTSTAPSNAIVAGPTYLATATATSGLQVVLTVDGASATVCTINNGTVSFIGGGMCTIDANQGGNATYAPAPEAQQSFTVSTAGGLTPQTITFTSTAPVNAIVAGPTYLASAAASSGLPVVLTIDPSAVTVCTINNGTVTFIGAGTCTIEANQGGNAIYSPAPQMQQSFMVDNAGGSNLPQTITFTSSAPVNATIGGPTYLATATATSGLPVILTIDAASGNECTINNGTVSFIGAGTCIIDANQGGNATYAPAPEVQQSFAVSQASGNHAPVGVGDAIEVASGGQSTTLVGDPHTPAKLVDNDFDADGDTLSASKLTEQAHGTVSVQPDGEFVYQNDGTGATDTFTYKACDASQCSAPTTVTITIGNNLDDHVPFAVGDAVEVAPSGMTNAIVGDARVPASVLDNDIDPDHDALTAAKLTNPAHGDLVMFNADGTFGYHNTDPSATTDGFLYQACDHEGACDLGVVTITIGNNLSDHLPVVVDDAIQATPNPPGNVSTTLVGDLNNPASVLDNDSDPDAGDVLTAVKVSGLLNDSGTLVFDADGTFTYTYSNPVPTTDSFLYEACDGEGACKPGLVNISITNAPMDLPPIAADDAIAVAPHGITSALVGDANVPNSVLDNDNDPNDAHATLKAYPISAPSNGTVTLNDDGTFVYTNTTPTADAFQYEACDPSGACVPATVSITINAAAPTVTCVLPTQVDMVGDTVSLDLSHLFAPPSGQSLTYSVTNPPPSLSIMGSLLTGTLSTAGTFANVPLNATTVPGGVSASEDVTFVVLPTGEILFRNGFDDSTQSPSPPSCY